MLLLGIVFSFPSSAQTTPENPTSRKGDVYIYWGWNRSAYTRSDIHFKGTDYDFTLFKAKGKDRQEEFALNPFLHPGELTIPQYNFRIGYFFNSHYNLSFGIDHMKYIFIEDTEHSSLGFFCNNSIKICATV